MSPLVSILIPAYNAAPWITATLASALAQTHRPIEIIVVDDGSTDATLAIARNFEASGVRVVSQSNAGASAARNHALRLAQGDYIQFLDADDLLAPEKIAAQVARLADAPSLSLASGQWGRFTQDLHDARFDPSPNHRDLTGIEFLQLFFEHGAMMQPGAWLAPRSLLKAAGPWDETLSLNDDGEYFARVMLRASGIRYCAAARVFYRSSLAGSLSRRRDPLALASSFRATESIVSQLTAADSSERTRAAAAYAWKWTAFELYPEACALSREASRRCAALGDSRRPLPAGPHFQLLAKFIGWRLAKRLRPV